MIQIFLSYAREDYAVVRRLYDRLRDSGYKPWMDKVDLPKGADFAKAIPKVLRESDLFIVCLSQNSVEKRSFIQREINLALDAWEQKLDDDLYIFPVRLEACKAPDRISKFNWTDLFGDEEEEEWNALLQALRSQAERLGKVTSPVSDVKPAKILPPSFTETINGVPLKMILVPGGEFLMGSTEAQVQQAWAMAKEEYSGATLEWFTPEMPQHRVTISPFYFGKFQITRAQWQAVMGDNLEPRFKGDNLPMDSVSWHDAKSFCQRLSALTGKEYRLPAEAEWEYACRAGTTGDYAGNLDEMAWYGKNSGIKTHPVGQKKPNTFGLYDLHGNVWEWCEDVWHDNYNDAPNVGLAWTVGGNSDRRILRGGGWGYYGFNCRSARRYPYAPDDRHALSVFVWWLRRGLLNPLPFCAKQRGAHEIYCSDRTTRLGLG